MPHIVAVHQVETGVPIDSNRAHEPATAEEIVPSGRFFRAGSYNTYMCLVQAGRLELKSSATVLFRLILHKLEDYY